jgi:hypothetical protein
MELMARESFASSNWESLIGSGSIVKSELVPEICTGR